MHHQLGCSFKYLGFWFIAKAANFRYENFEKKIRYVPGSPLTNKNILSFKLVFVLKGTYACATNQFYHPTINNFRAFLQNN